MGFNDPILFMGDKEQDFYPGEVKDLVISTLKKIHGDRYQCGLEKWKNYNPGLGEGKVPTCPPKKEKAIMDAFRHFNLV